VPVLTPSTETDDPSVCGELAYIVAKDPGRPRAGGSELDQRDNCENLMLLCNEAEQQRAADEAHPGLRIPGTEAVADHRNENKLRPMVQDCVATSYSFPDHSRAEDDAIDHRRFG
jgi:hypothetical protein